MINNVKNNIKYFFSLLLISCFSVPVVNADVTMGIVPQNSPIKLFKIWNPVIKYLEEKTGEKIVFKAAKSISLFEKTLLNGQYDFAYMNPYQYIQAHVKHKYIAQVRAQKNIRGILVRKISSSKSFKDKEVKYVFSSPNAFAATLLTKYGLIKSYHINPKVFKSSIYVGSHDSVYKNISLGVGDIGGGIERTFNSTNYTNLRIIYKTKPYPSHPFAFKESMNKKVKKKIIQALLEMPAKLLQALNMKKMKKINHEEYRSIEKLTAQLHQE